MPAGNPFAYEPMRLGSAFLQGEAIARDREQQRQAMALRQAAEDRARQENDFAQKVRPLDLTGRQLALRGQILGTVETPEDYARVLPAVQELGLPTGDLPDGPQSSAWLTFRKQDEPRTAPAWLPERFAPAPLVAPQARAMPEGLMQTVDIPVIQRAAGRGLTIGQQTQFSDKNIGRQLQEAQIAANLAKYEEQGRYRESAESRAEQAASLGRQKTAADIETARINASIKRRELETSGAGGQALAQAVKDLPTQRENAKTALTGLETLTRMEELLSSGAGARPGMIKVGIGRLFGYQSEDMAQAEEYQLLAETLRGPLREDIVGPGPMTEAEQRLLGQVTGGGSTGIKAAKALLANYKEKSRKKIEAYNRQVQTLSKYDATIPDLYAPIEFPSFGAPATRPTAPAQYKETKTYNGATYGRNSPSEKWKLVK